MTESKKKYSRSDIASFLAVIMSVSALAIGIVEARIMADQQAIMAEQQKGSVWPYMEVKSSVLSANDSLVFGWTAENKGVGPAIVKRITLMIKEKPYYSYSNFLTAVDSIMGKDTYELNQFTMSKSIKSVYAPGDKKTLFQITFYDQDAFLKKIGYFNLSLKYCSIYGDCWRENGKEIVAKDETD